MKKRGRPTFSQIRQNIVELLAFMHSGYGYEIYKKYVEIFPKVAMRSVYYHLKKGVSLEEIKVDRIEKVEGLYSWGPSAEKTFYALGKNAITQHDKRVKDYFDNQKKNEI